MKCILCILNPWEKISPLSSFPYTRKRWYKTSQSFVRLKRKVNKNATSHKIPVNGWKETKHDTTEMEAPNIDCQFKQKTFSKQPLNVQAGNKPAIFPFLFSLVCHVPLCIYYSIVSDMASACSTYCRFIWETRLSFFKMGNKF